MLFLFCLIIYFYTMYSRYSIIAAVFFFSILPLSSQMYERFHAEYELLEKGIFRYEHIEGTDDEIEFTFTGQHTANYRRDRNGNMILPKEMAVDGKTYRLTRIGKNFCDLNCYLPDTIPDFITSIGVSAFKECRKKEIIIPESVTSIGPFAFADCYNLQKIAIPEKVNSIGICAFSNCHNLQKIIIPEKVRSIGEKPSYIRHSNVFSNCKKLQTIDVHPDNPYFQSLSSVLYTRGVDTLIAYPVGKQDSVFHIPHTVKSISSSAFNDCLLKRIYFPDSLRQIKNDVFIACINLDSVILPKNLKTIGSSAFYGCTNLQYILLPDSISEISSELFSRCENLKNIIIPENVTEIGKYAFSDCKNMYFTIPEKVEKIGKSAFSGTPWYEQQPNGLVYAGKVLYEYKGEMPQNTRINVKSGAVSIAEGAFYLEENLSSVIFPEGLKYIGDAAFGSCSKLKKITIPGSVKEIGSRAFEHCDRLHTVKIGEGVEKIGTGAFYYTTKMKKLYIPQSIQFIADGSFSILSILNEIHVYWADPSVVTYGKNNFNCNNSKCKLIVPKGTKHLYQQSEVWKDFNIVERKE